MGAMKTTLKKFLIEDVKKELDADSHLAYQALLDNLDDAYFIIKDDKIVINVGNVIRKSKYNNLHIVIRNSDEDKVRYGNSKEFEHCIVIDTNAELPKRKSVDEFILSNKSIASKVKEYMKHYCIHDVSDDIDEDYENEKSNNLNNEESGEKLYQKIESYAETMLERFEKQAKELEKSTNSVNLGKTTSVKLAKKKLQEELFGKSKEEFTNKMIKDFDEIKHMDKEYINKIRERLFKMYELRVGK